MTETYIVYAKRTIIGNLMGALKDYSAVDLGAALIKDLLKDTGVPNDSIDDVIIGNVLQAGSGQNPARQIIIKGGISEKVPAATINKVCGSGLYTASLAHQGIKSGECQAVIAGGVESMSNAPYLVSDLRKGRKMGDGTMIDSMLHDGLWEAFNDYHMGVTGESVALLKGITRQEQDEFALASQMKAAAAQKNGVFMEEIVPLHKTKRNGEEEILEYDEYIRPNTTMEQLSKLKPVFQKEGTLTAGNSSGINDGAAILLLCSKEYMDKYDLRPIAKLISYASSGVDPAFMGLGPIEAIKKAVKKADIKLEDVGLYEINEAFAAQSAAVIKELGIQQDRVNVNGGSIALGHPIGASGARIMVTLLHEMMRRKEEYAVASLCVGGGMGEAVVLQRWEKV